MTLHFQHKFFSSEKQMQTIFENQFSIVFVKCIQKNHFKRNQMLLLHMDIV